MKLLKVSTFIVIAVIALINIEAFAERTPKNSAVGPGFEILNKSKQTIQVTLYDQPGVKGLIGADDIPANSKRSIQINIDKPLIIKIPQGLMAHVYMINTKGKTKYLTWNPEKYQKPAQYLYPQTGPYKGWTGKSESGFDLSKNVTQADIKYTKE